MIRTKGKSATEFIKKDWSPDFVKTVVAILLADKTGWVHWVKATNPSWATIDAHEYDKNWGAVFVLTDLNVSDCFKSRDQFLAYLKEMMTRHVGPFGACDAKRFEKARVAYIQQLIAYTKRQHLKQKDDYDTARRYHRLHPIDTSAE
jgi:hypothetical protein